jgi:hypothetical protein
LWGNLENNTKKITDKKRRKYCDHFSMMHISIVVGTIDCCKTL